MIAEIGLNHNGDIDLARRIADSAFESGANAAKFQIFSPDHFISGSVMLSAGSSLKDFFSQFVLGEKEWILLSDHVGSLGMDFFCSVFDDVSLEFYLQNLNPSLVKTASGDMNNRILIEKASRSGIPFILSTGTADQDEVDKALQWVPGDVQLILMHCVSSYPAKIQDYNLNVLSGWREKYSYPLGLSDHTESDTVSIAAVALGACVIEKHFTLDKNMPGPDQKLSLNPAEFSGLVRSCRDAFDSLGDGRKKCSESELPARNGGRRSLHASQPVSQGEEFSENNIIPLRPAGGVDADKFYDFPGRMADRNYEKGDRLLDAFLKT